MVAFELLHVAAIIDSLYNLRRVVSRQKTRAHFANKYDHSIYHQLQGSKLLGHA